MVNNMVESMLKAYRLLEQFSYEKPRLSLAELAKRLAMPKSTAHNLLNTLRSIGFVEKTDTDEYALGIGFLPLTQYLRVNVEIRDRAAPLLRELADACNESIYLGVQDRHHCRIIYVIETSSRLQARSALGGVSPLHASGIGKAMLAFLPDVEADRIIAATGIPAHTSRTISDPARLRNELSLIRERGFSTDDSENEERIYCLGAPILDDRGNLIASCSLSGIDPEIVRTKLAGLSACILHTAQGISSRMGYVPRKIAHHGGPGYDPLGDYRRSSKKLI